MSLENIIKTTIIQKTRPIGFDEFINLALYHNKYGYYRSSKQKFGVSGDFVTAPELSPIFGKCLAKQFSEILKKNDSILEFGAGSGILAVNILEYLAKNNKLPKKYYIIELSAHLQKIQANIIKKYLPNQLSSVKWLKKMPVNFNGVVIANEVLDAMPFKRFLFEKNRVFELCVDYKNNEFIWHKAITKRKFTFTPPSNCIYKTEINDYIKPWLLTLFDALSSAVVFIIDYGYGASEYYHIDRTEGTLRCYYKQRASEDIFSNIGSQDITASVNFSDVANSAKALGFSILGYTTQGHFLVNLGIFDMLDAKDKLAQIKLLTKTKQLVLPGAMGEVFKVIALYKGTKNSDIVCSGFSHYDMSHKL